MHARRSTCPDPLKSGKSHSFQIQKFQTVLSQSTVNTDTKSSSLSTVSSPAISTSMRYFHLHRSVSFFFFLHFLLYFLSFLFSAEMDFRGMKRKQLQALCKQHGVPANSTNLEMADRLSLFFKVWSLP